jgi:hypothetical protein
MQKYIFDPHTKQMVPTEPENPEWLDWLVILLAALIIGLAITLVSQIILK